MSTISGSDSGYSSSDDSFVVDDGYVSYDSDYAGDDSDSENSKSIPLLGKKREREGLLSVGRETKRVRRPLPFSSTSICHLTQEMENEAECPVLGRDAEVARLVPMLIDSEIGVHPLLIGAPKIGKTAIVKKLAWQIKHRESHKHLRDRPIVMIDFQAFVSKQLMNGEGDYITQTFIDKLKSQFRKDPATIFFLKNINYAFKNDTFKDYIHLMASHRWSFIASAQEDKMLVKVKSEFGRYFVPIAVEPFRFADVIQVVSQEAAAMKVCETSVSISSRNVRYAVQLAREYLSDDPAHVAATRVIRQAAVFKIMGMESDHNNQVVVDFPGIKKAVALYNPQFSGEFGRNGKEAAEILRRQLTHRVVGQEHAIHTLCEYVSLFRDGFCDFNKPPGVFLLTGPTGVGKTELAKSLQKYLYGDPCCFFRFDMSEYVDRESAHRFIGAPPGYVGHEDGGRLVQAVKEKRRCVVLFDELEKAHPDIWNLCLQVFDEGRLTDGKGDSADFTKAFIFVTTNLNPDEIHEHLRPELIGRFDAIIELNPLKKKDLPNVAEAQLDRIAENEKEKYSLSWQRNVLQYLARTPYDASFGMRHFCDEVNKIVYPALQKCKGDDDVLEGNVVLKVQRRALVARKEE